MNIAKKPHPAKYNDKFIEFFYNELKYCEKILDPMSGTGKIGKIKEFGYNGIIYSNELEEEWAIQGIINGCDFISCKDAGSLPFTESFFDGVCTSPTYGNRMADHHNAKDGSKRNTYTHKIGRKLKEGNTGKMQWSDKYKEKHIEIYKEIRRILKKDGLLVLNIKNHIRSGEEIDVSGWTLDTLKSIGFELIKEERFNLQGNGFGANGKLRVSYESIYVMRNKK